jgi:hypothetical protein
MLAVLLVCLPAFSQGSFGRILGTVTDQTGGVVAGATVTVIDTERGVSRALVTDDAGVYNAPNLTAGNYTVRVEAKGFKRIERQGIVMEVGHEVRVDLTVQPGEQNQTVTVTEAVPLVETTNATLGGTLDNADIADLPLNGRDYQNLLGLRPGVVLQPGGGPWTQSTNGVRPDESVWMVEGVYNANFFDGRPVMGMASPFTDSASILPVDAIQEFNLMENPKAEYGWHPGAVVNVGIKSGTNQLHGAAYAFGRTDSWDARNYFNPVSVASGCLLISNGQCTKVPAQLKQFGGVAGGPIKKDKLFFFGGYEGLRSEIGFAGSLNVPSTASLGASPTATTQSMVDAINALKFPTVGTPVALSAQSLNMAGCTTGATAAATVCTGNLFPNTGTATSFLSTFPNLNTSDNGIGKLDYHANDKNTINGMFYYGHYNATGEDHPFSNLAATDTVPIRTLTTTASWVYTPNSNIVNELRFGYDRITFDFVNLDVGTVANGTNTAVPINTGVTDALAGGMPNIRISGFGTGGTPVLGTATNRPQYWTPNPYYDFQDSVSYLKGKHSFKFGAEFTHIEADSAIYVLGRGSFNFNGNGAFNGSTPLEDFFAGTPTNGQLLIGNPSHTLRWMNYAGYAQDDWRVTPKLIVNLGLRYEYVSPMKDINNNLGSFDPTKGMVQQGLGGMGAIYNGDRNGFEPRIGFAYDMNGKGTTVIRGGASLIHTSFSLATFLAQFSLQNNNATTPGAVPTGAAIQCDGVINVGCPTQGTGTISLGAVTYQPSRLCWDPTNPITPACTSGQKTVFPAATGGGAVCGDGLPGDASPCDIMGVDPNLKSPFVVNYSLGITHAFTPNLSIEIGYVGNHGYRLLNFHDINQAQLGSANCLNTLTAAQLADACGPNRVLVGTPPAQCVVSTNPAVNNCSGNGIATQEARPYYTKFPYLGFINYVNNSSHSRYDSLQVSVTKRISHGLSFTGGYTYGHNLDNGSLNRFGLLPQNSNLLGAEYASSDFDIRNRFTATVTYNIPGIKGFAQMLEGWQLNSIVNIQSAQPWAAYDGGDNFSGTGEFSDRWNIAGNPADFVSGKQSIPYCTGFTDPGGVASASGASCVVTTVYGNVAAPSAVSATSCLTPAASAATLTTAGCYVSANGKSVITPAALGTFGNMGRNIFRDSGFKNVDFSIFKNFTFKERYGAQFRAEGFNIFNHPLAANPYGASSAVNGGNGLGGGGFGYSGFTPDYAAGNPLIGSGSNRAIQLGLKLTF